MFEADDCWKRALASVERLRMLEADECWKLMSVGSYRVLEAG